MKFEQFGNIKLYNADCMEVIKGMPNRNIDLIITDPPYKFENKGGGFFAKNNSTQRTYLDNLRNIKCTEFEPLPFLDILKDKLKKFYGYFFCNKSLVEDYIRFARDNKYIFDILVMAKSNPIPSYNNHHLSDLEYVIMIRENGTYFSKHKNIDDFRKFYLKSSKKGMHPAEKPVDLIERYIRTSSKEGDVIFDPFMGSGTTGVACVNTNRSFVGIELDNNYFNIAKTRVNDVSKDNQLTLF